MEEELKGVLSLESRQKIYDLIQSSPGLHFREIQRRTGLATGSLQYHLEYLEKKHLIRQVKEKKFSRFYLVREPFYEEKEMGALRQESSRKIMLFLLQKKRGASNKQISKAIELSPSTTSWHLENLFAKGLLAKKRRGKKIIYSLVDPQKAAEVLVSYRKSFFDEMVDNFATVWEQI